MLESRKLENFLKLANAIALIILVNVIANSVFVQWDLTEEKRFSISEATKKLLTSLDETVFVEVYLEGDLPPGFMRLRNSTREILEQFQVYSKSKVEFEFINPDKAVSVESRNEFFMQIAEKGVQPTDIFLTEDGNRIQKRILPGAVVSYGTRERGVLLLKGNKGAPAEVQLNQSVENVEYELARTISDLVSEDPRIVGLSVDHGELSGAAIIGFREALEERFFVREINFQSGNYGDYPELVIVPKPTTAFSSAEIYHLDQFVMHGGKIIFLIDALMANVDSTTISMPYSLGLDDLFFRYGVRLNKDLVIDYQSAPTPLVVGNMGDQPQIQLLPWPFYPLVNSYANHPMVRNMDAVKLAFAGSIDTVKAEGITKTPVLFTSNYSRRINAPVRIDLDELKKPLDPSTFNQSHIPLGYLLEGAFTSAFQNRPKPVENGSFLEKGATTKIVVIADGDLVRNEFNPRTGQPLALGEEYYTRVRYANEDFMLNIISYMLDEDGLILSRNKEIVLRPLDAVKIREGRFKWQVVNIAFPILMILILGMFLYFNRKRRFASF